MIRIHSLLIEDFRGIRKLQLDFQGQNFAICGPNGTGKSGVVDAIEFAITGSITRLTGQGTSAVSLKTHGPHVDYRDEPGKARVTLRAHIPSLDKFVTIERQIGSPNVPMVHPNEHDIRIVVDEVAQHPEFALSRREIIKYVLAAPGERSKEVQALLRLDQIERVRLSLQYIANSLKGQGQRIEEEVSQAKAQLMRGLGISSLRKEDVLREANRRRQTLQLAPLTELEPTTSLKSGVVASGEKQAGSKVVKNQALLDLAAFSECLDSSKKRTVIESRIATERILKELLENPALLRSLRQEQFLSKGIALIDDNLCPFCDLVWDVLVLREHVLRKIDEARQATELKTGLYAAAQPLMSILVTAEKLASTLSAYGKQLSPPVDARVLAGWAVSLRARHDQLLNLVSIEDLLTYISGAYLSAPTEIPNEIAGLAEGIAALPEPSSEQEARDYLTICQERLDVYREARRAQDRIKNQTELANHVLKTYNETSTSALTQIYKDVEQDFSKYYRTVNREDEAAFHGKLVPSIGKLGFDVEFYGRGYFPPGAYHSEGHQDAMGICLYLALMKHTLGPNFTFAVLDDVLMSVDKNHRREVCALLKSEFPTTQFVMTTHDPVWLQHMKTEQLITTKSSVHFQKWTVDDGPVVWDAKEIWKEISEQLDKNDISGAAGTLRRYLEYISNHLSDRLRATIEFHGDAQYELGELLPGVVLRWKKLLARAQEAAQSWGRKKDEGEQLSKRQGEFGTLVARSQVEQWAMNKSIHYNEWMTLSKQEFVPVVQSFRTLLDSLRCDKCGGFFYVTPPKGPAEAIRCDCGSVNINLKKKQ